MRRWSEREVTFALVALLLFSSSAFGQNHAPAFPREGAEKALDSNTVLAWKMTITKGDSTGLRELTMDQVSVALDDGEVKFTRPDGTWSIEPERTGSVRFDSKGTVIGEEGVGDQPIHFVVFQLKDDAPHPEPMVNGIPGMFPREGATKLLETDRITVWDQIWKPGELSKLHLHYNHGAAVFLSTGTLQGITNGVKTPLLPKKPGDVIAIKQLTAPHQETELGEPLHAVFIAFK
jgi:hypothetical protein